MNRKDGPIGDDELDGLFGHLSALPLALAVSGGADSMALMHLVARWASREEQRAKWAGQCRLLREEYTNHFFSPEPPDRRGLAVPAWLAQIDDLAALDDAGGPPRVVVLSVDHGLRPEAASEAAFVAEQAQKLGLPCEVLRWEGPKPSTGIQEAAREARRALMLDWLRAEASMLVDLANCAKRLLAWHVPRTLLLAHHRDDQAETVLMRLARGSGLEGLGGMRERGRATRGATAERPTSFHARVWRPLLNLPKQRLIDSLKAGGHAWLEDPSNHDERFERVRIRKAMAALGDLGLTAEKIALSARRLRDADDSVRVLLGRWPDGSALNALLADVPLGSSWFASPYAARRSLRGLLRRYGGDAREAELAQVEELATRLVHEDSRTAFTGATLGGCKIEVAGPRRDRVRVFREGNGEGLAVAALVPGHAIHWDGGRFLVRVAPDIAAGTSIAALGMAGWSALKKAVPELAGLGWPAAAAATLPAVVRDRAVVAVPAMADLIAEYAGKASPLLAAWRSSPVGAEGGIGTFFAGDSLA